MKAAEQASFFDPGVPPLAAAERALKLIELDSLRIDMYGDRVSIHGPLVASAKADPEAAFRALGEPAAPAPAAKQAEVMAFNIHRAVVKHAIATLTQEREHMAVMARAKEQTRLAYPESKS